MYDNCADEYCVAEKWHLLELFTRAAFYAGLCYVQAGDLRGAKSTLLHCLVFCEAFRMCKRFYLAFICSLLFFYFNLIVNPIYSSVVKPLKVKELELRLGKTRQLITIWRKVR